MNFADKTIGSLETGDTSFEGYLLSDRYKIIRKIGEGGMGAVFLAEDTELDNRPVAIKSLPLIVVGNERSLKQLKKEAKLALKLSHPNIVSLRSFESSDHGPYLVMDYIAGKTLEAVLTEKERLSEEEVLRLFRPIAVALDYAHSQGVVHRDIKPSNIMIREDGTPFIMDFGIAREMKESFTRLTGKDTSGTLPYMSPEQIRGETPDPAQDIYSLSAAIFECFEGNPPFFRGQIEYQIINQEPVFSVTPKKIRKILTTGLAKDPKLRPEFCATMFDGNVKKYKTGKQTRKSDSLNFGSKPSETSQKTHKRTSDNHEDVVEKKEFEKYIRAIRMAVTHNQLTDFHTYLQRLENELKTSTHARMFLQVFETMDKSFQEKSIPVLRKIANKIPDSRCCFTVAQKLFQIDQLDLAKTALENVLIDENFAKEASELMGKIYNRAPEIEKEKIKKQKNIRLKKFLDNYFLNPINIVCKFILSVIALAVPSFIIIALSNNIHVDDDKLILNVFWTSKKYWYLSAIFYMLVLEYVAIFVTIFILRMFNVKMSDIIRFSDDVFLYLLFPVMINLVFGMIPIGLAQAIGWNWISFVCTFLGFLLVMNRERFR
jgi:serine/threonine protein kinase